MDARRLLAVCVRELDAIGSLALAAFVWVLTAFTGSFRPKFVHF